MISVTGILGLGGLGLFVLLLALLSLWGRKRPARLLRELPGFARLPQAIGLSVEAGKRLHITLGRGNPLNSQIASALVGLGILERTTRLASVSDNPPVATSGDGVLAVLSQDTLRSTFRAVGATGQYQPIFGRATGLTAFSYAAGTMPVISDEQVATTVCAGHFGAEVGLILEAAQRQNNTVIAGSDNLSGQAVMVAAAQEPLIGEELFAAGAYLRQGQIQSTSLLVQDIFRWLLIAALITGAIIKFFGFL